MGAGARIVPGLQAAPGARRARLTGDLTVRDLGLSDYAETWQRMRTVTEGRDDASPDELWLVEHPPVYTLGQAGRREHLLDAGPIPVVASDRGGQVTYHGPGQLIAYVLVDLRRRGLGVRHLVAGLEQSVIRMLAAEGIDGERRERAPGVYVAGRKICALGLRICNGRSYHGLALNVHMDLAPYAGIDPCGYRGLQVTQLRDLGVNWGLEETGRRLVAAFCRQFGYQARCPRAEAG